MDLWLLSACLNQAEIELQRTQAWSEISRTLPSDDFLPACNYSGFLGAKKKSEASGTFSSQAPLLWNSLPAEIRAATSAEMFKSRL